MTPKYMFLFSILTNHVCRLSGQLTNVQQIYNVQVQPQSQVLFDPNSLPEDVCGLLMRLVNN